MNEEKYIQSDTTYLDIAKNVTGMLHDLCIESKENYNIITVIAGISIGFYMFIKELANMIDIDTEELLSRCTAWMDWASSIQKKS